MISQLLAHRLRPEQEAAGRQMILAAVNWTAGRCRRRRSPFAGSRLDSLFRRPTFPTTDWHPVGAFYAFEDLVARADTDPAGVGSGAAEDHRWREARPGNRRHTHSFGHRRTYRRQLVAIVLVGSPALPLHCVLLAAIGIYGLSSSHVSARLQEVGIRVALGAARGSILTDVSAAGTPVGDRRRRHRDPRSPTPAHAGFATLLFGVDPGDPMIYAAASLLAMFMTLAGSLRPAMRAAVVRSASTIRD